MAFAPRNSAPKTTRRQRDLPRRAAPTPSRAAPTPKTKHRPVRETIKPKLGLGAIARLGAAAARARGNVAYRTAVMQELADDDENTEPDDFWVDESRPKAPPPPVQPWLEDTIPAEADVVQMKEDVDLDPLAPANFPQWPLPSNAIRELCSVCRVDLNRRCRLEHRHRSPCCGKMCCRRCLEAAPNQECPVCSGVYRDDAYAQLMRLQDAALKGDDARAVYDWSWWEYRSGDGETFAAGEKLIDLYECVERARRAVDQEDETLTDIESFKARRNVLSRELRELTSGTRADPDGPEAALARATCARTRGYLLLRKAALMGLASAWFDLSGLFLEGLVVEYDDRLSDFLLAYACAQKLPEARVETAERAFDVGDNELGRKLMAEAARDDYEAAIRLVLPRRLPEKAVALVLEYHDGIGLEEPPLVEVPIRTVDVDMGDEAEMLRSALDALEASDAALDAMSSEDRPKAALEAVGDVLNSFVS